MIGSALFTGKEPSFHPPEIIELKLFWHFDCTLPASPTQQPGFSSIVAVHGSDAGRLANSLQ